ncbi:MAG: hypothetical protein NWE91_05990 [Candidatus Bathyarchaeota archaeon]|nr:hypothetical protein [Candidatus Bathyarchaeota archaeon]
MNSVLFDASKDLIDDAKAGCADLVFKEVCLEILARAKNVLDDGEFKALLKYASERMQEKTVISVDAVR